MKAAAAASTEVNVSSDDEIQEVGRVSGIGSKRSALLPPPIPRKIRKLMSSSGLVGLPLNNKPQTSAGVTISARVAELVKGVSMRSKQNGSIVKIVTRSSAKGVPPCAFCNGMDSVCSINISLRHKDVQLLKLLCLNLQIDFEHNFKPLLQDFPFCCHCWSDYNTIYTTVVVIKESTSLTVVEDSLQKIQNRRNPNGENSLKVDTSAFQKFISSISVEETTTVLNANKPPIESNKIAISAQQATPTTVFTRGVSVTNFNKPISVDTGSSKPVSLYVTAIPVTPIMSAQINALTTINAPFCTTNIKHGAERNINTDPLSLEANGSDEEGDALTWQIKAMKSDHTYCSTLFFQCDLCQEALENSEALMGHLITHHSSSPQKFVCLKSGCGRSFVSSALLKKHMDMHKQEVDFPIYCDICEDRFNTDEALHVHLDKHKVILDAINNAKPMGSWSCLFCGYRLFQRTHSFAALRKHEQLKHQQNLVYACDEDGCSEQYSHEYLLQAHKVCHQPPPALEDLLTEADQRKYSCLVCKFEFDSVKALKYHLLIHLDFHERREVGKQDNSSTVLRKISGKLKFGLCNNCGIPKNKKHIQMHLLACLNVARNCEKCPEFYFPTAIDMINHIIEWHESNETTKQYQCCHPNCTKSFSTVFMFKRHLRYHDSVQCPLCELEIPKSKEFKETWKAHVKLHRSSRDNRFRCTVCALLFRDEICLSVHQKRHPELFKFMCPICDKHFSSKTFLNTHLLTHQIAQENVSAENPPKLQCHCCSIFPSADELDNHLTSHTGDDLFLCDLCAQSNLQSPSLFRSKEGLEDHIKASHSEEMEPLPMLNFDSLLSDSFNFEAYLRPETFLNAETLDQLSEPPTQNDLDVNSTLENDNGGRSGSKRNPNGQNPKKMNVTCSVCNKTIRKSRLKGHEFMHPELFIHKCLQPGCNSNFKLGTELLTHSQIHKDNLTQLDCFCCPKMPSFSTSEELVNHLSRHTNDHSATCPHCGRVLRNRNTLKDHIVAFHEPQSQNFQCDECCNSYALLKNLQKHKQSAHSKSQYVCDECGQLCRSRISLYSHKRDHHCKETEQCEHCGEMISKYKFKIHLLKKHGIDIFVKKQKPGRKVQQTPHLPKNPVSSSDDFTCYFCSRHFPNMYVLNYHMSQHTNEKSHRCSYCNKGFANPQRCQYHRNRRHPNARQPSDRVVNKTTRQVRRFGAGGPFTCTTCGKKYPTQYLYNIHMNFHRGIRPFQCSICGKKFSNYLSRAGHMMSHQRALLKCNICENKAFVNRNQYNYHMNEHKGKYPYKCHICGVRFAHSGWFRGHKKTHEMWGDYTKRPDHLKGRAPDSDSDESGDERTSTLETTTEKI